MKRWGVVPIRNFSIPTSAESDSQCEVRRTLNRNSVPVVRNYCSPRQVPVLVEGTIFYPAFRRNALSITPDKRNVVKCSLRDGIHQWKKRVESTQLIDHRYQVPELAEGTANCTKKIQRCHNMMYPQRKGLNQD